MGRPGLARTAVAAVALSVPVIGVIAVPAVAANAATQAENPQWLAPIPSTTASSTTTTRTLNSELAAYAKTLEGIPYRYGGTTRAGFDCSGLTGYVYRHFGKSIPRTAEDQFRSFHRITKAQAKPGDLVFIHVSSNPGSYVYHVGIYEGGDNMVVASTGAGRVKLQSFAWAGNTVTFGTITH